MTEFPDSKLQALIQAIDQALEDFPDPSQAVAAFDADGTLWNTDLGESLLQYQIRQQLVPGLPPDPWNHYHRMKEEISPEAAYLWLAQINAGLPLSQIRQWAQEAVDQLRPVPVFPSSKALVAHLKSRGVRVYIVTASIQWAVEPGAPLVGLEPEQVIGIRTKTAQGLIGTEQEGALTYREGKVKGLLEKTKGIKPFFCAGNSEGDLPLLESSTHLRLVMAASPPDNDNYQAEREMLQIARDRNWHFHDFL